MISFRAGCREGITAGVLYRLRWGKSMKRFILRETPVRGGELKDEGGLFAKQFVL